MENIKNIFEVIQNKEAVEILIAVLILVLFIAFSSVFAKLISKLFKVRNIKINGKPIYRNLKFIFIILGIFFSISFLQLPANFTTIFNKIIKIALIILTTGLVADFMDPKMNFIKKIVKDNKKGEGSIKFITRLIKGLIYTIGVFIIIAELGYDLSGIITGLGLSGVVIALAAQDIAKNLFAGFAILSDKTFIVGDYIEIDKISGTIEDISFRTTRIRTMDNSLITVPNSVLADGKVVNWSKNIKRKYEFNLRFKLNSNVATLKEISNRIKFVLKTNKDIIQDNININFTNISEDAIVLNIYFYTGIVEYTEFLKFKSDINMLILSILEKEKVELAYPTKIVIQN